MPLLLEQKEKKRKGEGGDYSFSTNRFSESALRDITQRLAVLHARADSREGGHAAFFFRKQHTDDSISAKQIVGERGERDWPRSEVGLQRRARDDSLCPRKVPLIT